MLGLSPENSLKPACVMNLSLADADLFFELVWSLQHYINQQRQIVPDVKTVEDYKELPLEDKMKVRQVLYDNPSLIDDFVAENPAGFSKDQLALVKAWKSFVRGDFYIERTLKKHAILIGSNDVVYGVLGLYEGLNEMIPKSRLPLLVRTVLLPFKGKIVYDGLFESRNIIFGGGIKGELKQIYLIAKEAGQIIENLDEAPRTPAEAAAAKTSISKDASKELSPLLNDLAAQAKSLRGGKGQPAFNGPIFSLIKASLELGQLAVDNPDDAQQMMKALGKTDRKSTRLNSSHYS